MQIEPEIDGVSIVLRGNFNPSIFTPSWFALHGLLTERVAAGASLDIAHRRVTAFQADWLRFHVDEDRCQAETTVAPHVRVRDLVVRMFREQLPHTPLRAFGINRDVHFRADSPEHQDRIGRTLAPVEPWGAWGETIGLDGRHGGMTSLTMSQLRPAGRPDGDQINVRVEPSKRINGNVGVFVNVNDHYAVGDGKEQSGEQLIQRLEDNFDVSLHSSDDVIDHIMSLARNPGS